MNNDLDWSTPVHSTSEGDYQILKEANVGVFGQHFHPLLVVDLKVRNGISSPTNFSHLCSGNIDFLKLEF